MPTITFTLTAAALNELVDTMCAQYGYQATIDGSPNPETRGQFAKRMLIVMMRERVKFYRRKEAEDAIDQTDPDIT